MADPQEYAQRRVVPPPGAVDVLLVRHGASMPWSPGNDFTLRDGHGDPELAPEGVDQAALLAGRLAGEHLDALYVSNLRRTSQTAEPLVRRTGLQPIEDPDLREVFLGDWEGGVFRQKVAEGDPVAMQMMEQQRWGVVPGGEDDIVFRNRVVRAIDRIAARHADQRVAVFTHGGVIGALLHHATGSRPFAFAAPDNCSISELFVLGDRWAVRRFNDTVHLGLPA